MFEMEERDAIKLNEKEKNYLGGLKVVYGDPYQSKETLHINPSYNLVNWMRVRNLQEEYPEEVKDVSTDKYSDLNFRWAVIEDGEQLNMREYIERVLEERGGDVKRERDYLWS